MKIAIANDHGGVALKKTVIAHLEARGHEMINVGSDSREIVRYPLFAAEAARLLTAGAVDRAILICSTGIGMSIIANKFKNVRAAVCTESYSAKMTRRHNDSNTLCLGGKITGENMILEICDVWLDEPYEGGRHDISLGIIADAESVMITGGDWSADHAYP